MLNGVPKFIFNFYFRLQSFHSSLYLSIYRSALFGSHWNGHLGPWSDVPLWMFLWIILYQHLQTMLSWLLHDCRVVFVASWWWRWWWWWWWWSLDMDWSFILFHFPFAIIWSLLEAFSVFPWSICWITIDEWVAKQTRTNQKGNERV